MSKTSHNTNEFKFLGAFASLVGLLSIALYFTGWVYRWAFYSFFQIELNALNLPTQSFFFVPMQIFLGSRQAICQTLLTTVFVVILIRVILWLILFPSPQKSDGLYSSQILIPRYIYKLLILRWVVNIRLSWQKLFQLVHKILFPLRWTIRQIFPSPLLKDLVIVSLVLTFLFLVSNYQGKADARRAAINDTSFLPVVTLVYPEKGLGLGRAPNTLDLFTDPDSSKTRVIGDVGLFSRMQVEATNDIADPNQPTSWRLLVNSNGWLYIFRTFPQNADANSQPLVLAIHQLEDERVMILSPLTSDSQSP